MAFSFRLRGKTHQAATLKALSEIYCALRDASCEGGSTFHSPEVREGNALVGHISYNGRIWTGIAKNWSGSTAILFDNRVEA